MSIGVLWVSARSGFAQTDEIQVYDAAIAEPGQFSLTLHNNFTPSGATSPGFPGALVANKSFNGVPEWAYGVTDWFEAGLYLPLYSVGTAGSDGTSAMLDGMKLRALFVAPHADERTFIFGANFEFSLNATHWDTSRFTSEIRPIVGWHLHAVDVILNPIIDTAYDGVSNFVFAPATRLAYNPTPTWALAVEEYGDFGPVHHFRPVDDQSHQLWGVLDHRTGKFNIEAGIGFGLTVASDHVTLKMILSRDLNEGRSSSAQQASRPD